MYKSRIGIATVAIVLLAVSLGFAEKERPTRAFMRQKLNYSTGVLEGITLERYDLVISNAVLLRDMSRSNVFLVLRNPVYLNNISNFQGRVDSLISAAQDKDLAAATASYARMAESCVGCHRQFRLAQFESGASN